MQNIFIMKTTKIHSITKINIFKFKKQIKKLNYQINKKHQLSLVFYSFMSLKNSSRVIFLDLQIL